MCWYACLFFFCMFSRERLMCEDCWDTLGPILKFPCRLWYSQSKEKTIQSQIERNSQLLQNEESMMSNKIIWIASTALSLSKNLHLFTRYIYIYICIFISTLMVGKIMSTSLDHGVFLIFLYAYPRGSPATPIIFYTSTNNDYYWYIYIYICEYWLSYDVKHVYIYLYVHVYTYTFTYIYIYTNTLYHKYSHK